VDNQIGLGNVEELQNGISGGEIERRQFQRRMLWYLGRMKRRNDLVVG
jgi:hypothetical protein